MDMKGNGIPEGDPRHGTRNGANLGCHCVECRAAVSAYRRVWAARQSPPPPGDWRHGAQGYANYGCRCDVCRAGHYEKMRGDYASRIARGLQPDDPRHGTRTGYTAWGCRCPECAAAYKKARRAKS